MPPQQGETFGDLVCQVLQLGAHCGSFEKVQAGSASSVHGPSVQYKPPGVRAAGGAVPDSPVEKPDRAASLEERPALTA